MASQDQPHTNLQDNMFPSLHFLLVTARGTKLPDMNAHTMNPTRGNSALALLHGKGQPVCLVVRAGSLLIEREH
jgi:hypothetical protein